MRRNNGIVTETAHLKTDLDKFGDNFDRIFKKKKETFGEIEDVYYSYDSNALYIIKNNEISPNGFVTCVYVSLENLVVYPIDYQIKINHIDLTPDFLESLRKQSIKILIQE